MKKPNFLFLLPDQFRRDWLGFKHQVPVRTPNLDRLAELGIVFNNAYTPSPLCAPARACLASGLDYGKCRVMDNNNDYPLDLPTYYQALRDNGYNVAGVGKFDLHKDTSKAENLFWELDGSRLLKEWGFTHGIDNEGKIDGVVSYVHNNKTPRGPYMKYLVDRGLAEQYIEAFANRKGRSAFTNPLPDEAYCDNWVAENGMKILKSFQDGKPWHLVVNFTGPHDPMEVTESMRNNWLDTDFPMPFDNDDFNPEAELERRRNYAAMIENIDRHIGRYIDYLKDTGQYENTIIIFSSDHGEMLGDHRHFGKVRWYEASAGIPLIISGPGVQKGISSNALVELHDLAATMLDYAGAEDLPNMDAESLRKLLSGECPKHRDFIWSAIHYKGQHWDMIYDGKYKFVQDRDEKLLFDLQNDPQEMHNVIADNQEIAGKLSKLIPAI